MAAPSIPNLSTLRGRTGLRGRGRGSIAGSASSVGPTIGQDRAPLKDRVVQQTDNDAASSRMSAVALGYLQDPFAAALAQSPAPRRYPLINRGTYVRTVAIDRLITAFIGTAGPGPKQIVSLGAGSDTRFFRFCKVPGLVYHEIDFAQNTRAKITKILEAPALRDTLHSASADVKVSESRDSLRSSSLNIHPLDLRSLSSEPEKHESLPNLDPQAPTLILSECCLTYISTGEANDILRHILDGYLSEDSPAGIILYEPIKPNDAFGQTMTSNLASRGIDMPSVRGLPTLSAHRKRLVQDARLSHGCGRTVHDIYSGRSGAKEEEWISSEERERVERLEWLDEVEEWKLLASHYCVVWGWRDGKTQGGDVFKRAWSEIAGQRTEDEKADDRLHGIEA